jgi:hypothetical protein
MLVDFPGSIVIVVGLLEPGTRLMTEQVSVVRITRLLARVIALSAIALPLVAQDGQAKKPDLIRGSLAAKDSMSVGGGASENIDLKMYQRIMIWTRSANIQLKYPPLQLKS